ncbi:hypothetical protein B0T19DRAFT_444174 [Cercophora scortea]|uniref:Uncharacterized protein n=1 Tax=Cercophora scortea TaxID=314031 RepID=A0AAE0IH22_9PEZI|nr:hypothetical protein B0T19DRAFT_444174 [Cercophora scortea]
MKLTALGLIVYLATGIAASGYRTSLEMVWMWYAYQIDLLNNPEASRSIGYRCSKWNPISVPPCEGTFEPCVGTRVVGDKIPNTCFFSEFIGWIVKGKPQFYAKIDITFPLGDKANLFPEVAGQATLLYGKIDKPYPPQNALRDSNGAYNDMLARVGHMLGDARYSMDTTTDINKIKALTTLLDAADEAMSAVHVARDIDHTPWLVNDWNNPAKNKDPNIVGIKPGLVPAGTFPVVPKQGLPKITLTPQFKFDIEQTVKDNPTIPDVEAKVRAYLANYYATDPKARDHKDVLDSMIFADNLSRGVADACSCARCTPPATQPVVLQPIIPGAVILTIVSSTSVSSTSTPRTDRDTPPTNFSRDNFSFTNVAFTYISGKVSSNYFSSANISSANISSANISFRVTGISFTTISTQAGPPETADDEWVTFWASGKEEEKEIAPALWERSYKILKYEESELLQAYEEVFKKQLAAAELTGK